MRSQFAVRNSQFAIVVARFLNAIDAARAKIADILLKDYLITKLYPYFYIKCRAPLAVPDRNCTLHTAHCNRGCIL